MNNNEGGGLLSVLASVRGYAEAGAALNAAVNNSLVAQLKSTMVSPVVLIDEVISQNPITKAICSLSLNQYTVMYTAVASRFLNFDISSARIQRVLETLGTDRDLLRAIGNQSDKRPANAVAAALASDARARVDNKQLAQIVDSAPLSMGKVVNLTFSGDKKGASYDVQVLVRLQTKICHTELIKAAFQANYTNLNPLSLMKLYHLGEITIGEMVTASNQIKAKEKLRMSDPEGIIRNNFIEGAKNIGYTAITGEVPINVASGINIVDSSTLRSIESMLRGRFDKYRVRQKFFENTACMLMVSVDHKHEMVEMYYRDLDDVTEIPFSWLEENANGGGTNLEPMIKDILSGSIPSIR